MFEIKDLILLLLGIACSVVANYIFKNFESSKVSVQILEQQLVSDDPSIKSKAAKMCFITAAKWYVIANIIWVVAGAAWVFDGMDRGVTMIVLFAGSAVSIFFFWLALRWIVRGGKAYAA